MSAHLTLIAPTEIRKTAVLGAETDFVDGHCYRELHLIDGIVWTSVIRSRADMFELSHTSRKCVCFFANEISTSNDLFKMSNVRSLSITLLDAE